MGLRRSSIASSARGPLDAGDSGLPLLGSVPLGCIWHTSSFVLGGLEAAVPWEAVRFFPNTSERAHLFAAKVVGVVAVAMGSAGSRALGALISYDQS